MNSDMTTKSAARRGRRLAATVAKGAVIAALAVVPFVSPLSSFPEALAASDGEAGVHPVADSMGFADIVARVKPAVISVRVKLEQFSQSGEGEDPGPGGEGRNGPEGHNGPEGRHGSPFRFFFHFGPDRQKQEPHVVTGQGSGFFISADGYAVTNNHVVDNVSKVEVTTDDGTIHEARVVGVDERTDLALIKVDDKNDFPFVTFAESEPRVGDWVIAVGNPFGLSDTVTAGIVSARGRNIGSGPYDDYMQIDAPINKGNSGGPAFNVNGQVIGVNSAIVTPTGGSVGIGFAIPSSTVKDVVTQLREHGKVTRGWLGVEVQNLTPDIAESISLKQARGALVAKLDPGGPGSRAGVKSGDVITAVNGDSIKDAHDLAMKVSRLAPGSSARVDVFRQGHDETFTATLGEAPPVREASNSAKAVPEADMRGLGLALAPAPSVNGAGDQGVAVTWVDPVGLAAEHGLQAGDVILDVGGKSVSTPNDVRKALGEAHASGKRTALFRLQSQNGIRFVALPVGKSFFGG